MKQVETNRLRSFARSRVFLLAALVVCAHHASLAQTQTPDSTPEVLHTPFGLTETGLLGGTPYRIDVPADWNHSLVVYFHGYQEKSTSFQLAERPNSQVLPLVQRRYAVVQSAYSKPGWALQQAYPESEALRKYFTKAYGTPHETYAAGGSLGGDLVSITLEINPKPYTGGLDLCGSVGPSYESLQRRFAWRAAFDFYFPELMPPLVPSPPEYEETAAQTEKILDALKSDPKAATELRGLTALHSDADVAHLVSYATFLVTDMQQRAGGNPFDNRNYLYTGTNPATSASDWALNDGVKRYAANEKAREYLVQHFTPSGKLQRPMLALHTIYDPIVPASSITLYTHQVEEAGFGHNLVQQYVHRDGHCTFSSDDVGRAFDELVDWTHGGPRPTPGLLR